MLGEGLFCSQLDTAEEILTDLHLLQSRQLHPNKSLGASDFKGLSYSQIYKKSLQNFAYDFQLVDHSFLLFIKAGDDHHNGHLSFLYYEVPVVVMDYEQFVASEFNIFPEDPNYQEVLDEWGDALRPEYELYFNSAALKKSVTPLRYDYKATQYRPGIHPASHLHFGFSSNIRFGMRGVLNPLSFLLFVLRQYYPEKFEELQAKADFPIWMRNIRENLDSVHDKYWQIQDETEHYIV